jgi:hypothetical protein
MRLPVIAAVESNHSAPAGCRLHKFDRRLYGVRSRRGTKLNARLRCELSRQCGKDLFYKAVLHRRCQIERVKRISFVKVFPNGRHYDWMVMAKREGSSATETIHE